jgi:hydroxyacylglutathione hydrolase
MMHMICFRFRQYNENSYLVYDETGECILIDPGCYSAEEKKQITDTIEALKLRPVTVVNTHCHIDHVFGNKYMMDRYQIPLHLPQGEVRFLEVMPQFAAKFGFDFQPVPKNYCFLKEGTDLSFGNSRLNVLSTPGHSPDSVSLVSFGSKLIFGGDVLFRNRIGRTDLAGGNYKTLVKSIQEKLFLLGDDMHVFSGHGPSTQIGYERETSKFICWTNN